MLNNIAALMGSPSGAVAGDYQSIETFTVGGGGSASITFSSIAADWQHLQIRGLTRGTTTAAWNYAKINSDATSGNYYSHEINGPGTTPYAAAYAGTSNGAQLFTIYPNTGVFGSLVLDLLDYTNINKNKTIRCLSGWDGNGSGEVRLSSALYSGGTIGNVSNTVTSITITSGDTFAEYSSFALYGIK